MEDITAAIKEYALVINPDLEEDDDFLDFVVALTIDRFLLYTNRDQLVEIYETDLISHAPEEEGNDDYWASYQYYPIPPRLQRVLAQVVVSLYKTVTTTTEGSSPAIQSMTDNGQTVTYKDSMNTYLSSASDAEIFGEAAKLIDRFRLLTVVENGSIRRLQN